MKTHHIYTLALMAGALGLMIGGLHTWSEAVSPQFVSGVVLAAASVLKGMYQDKPGEPSAYDIVKLNRREP